MFQLPDVLEVADTVLLLLVNELILSLWAVIELSTGELRVEAISYRNNPFG
jgi:hypothetical protein